MQEHGHHEVDLAAALLQLGPESVQRNCSPSSFRLIQGIGDLVVQEIHVGSGLEAPVCPLGLRATEARWLAQQSCVQLHGGNCCYSHAALTGCSWPGVP